MIDCINIIVWISIHSTKTSVFAAKQNIHGYLQNLLSDIQKLNKEDPNDHPFQFPFTNIACEAKHISSHCKRSRSNNRKLYVCIVGKHKQRKLDLDFNEWVTKGHFQ